jgi:hypothetical protein
MATLTNNQAPISIVCDEVVHTNAYPFCNDLTCPCHQDLEYVHRFLLQPWWDGLLSTAEALWLFQGQPPMSDC